MVVPIFWAALTPATTTWPLLTSMSGKPWCVEPHCAPVRAQAEPTSLLGCPEDALFGIQIQWNKMVCSRLQGQGVAVKGKGTTPELPPPCRMEFYPAPAPAIRYCQKGDLQ